MAHKVTFRFDDDVWAVLKRIADTAGVSVTALVQGAANVWGPHWDANDWASPYRWPESPLRDAWVDAVESAQRIDAERRTRRRGRSGDATNRKPDVE